MPGFVGLDQGFIWCHDENSRESAAGPVGFGDVEIPIGSEGHPRAPSEFGERIRLISNPLLGWHIVDQQSRILPAALNKELFL